MPILRFFFLLNSEGLEDTMSPVIFYRGIKDFFQPFMVNKNSIPKSEIKSTDADNAWKPKQGWTVIKE